MITVRKHIVTETAHRLLDYTGKCAHVHGHSYKWEVEVGGYLTSLMITSKKTGLLPTGILVDFKVLKRMLIELVHDRYDHALVLCDRDPLCGVPSVLAPPSYQGLSETEAPRLVIHPFNPTAENLATHVGKQVEIELASSQPMVRLVSFTVWETENSFARYIPESVNPETYR
jgi:6-pyruvoyltetrahydropterin/6-carboxytetrahydropterin synthase